MFVNWFEEQCDDCKSCESCEKCMNAETCEKRKSAETCENCKKAAKNVYEGHVEDLKNAAAGLGIQPPECVNVSVREGYTENILGLVDTTERLVEKHLPESDAWFLWALAQRVSLPSKMRACVSQAMTHYSLALMGSVPGIGQVLLSNRLVDVHKDIIMCLNFQDTDAVLNSEEFRHPLLYVVQDMKNKDDKQSYTSVFTLVEHQGTYPPPSVEIEKISQVVELCATAASAIAPPAAILGLSFIFVKWILDAVCDNVPEVQRVFIAYTVDLILVLRELFDWMLQLKSFGRVTWVDLGEAFDAYHRTPSRAKVHREVTELVERHRGMSSDTIAIHESVEELLRNHQNFCGTSPLFMQTAKCYSKCPRMMNSITMSAQGLGVYGLWLYFGPGYILPSPTCSPTKSELWVKGNETKVSICCPLVSNFAIRAPALASRAG
ncbi:hypothetical protein B0H16DRAFT_1738293 [Mycena metata]|uniref:Uncharacterized protein n=1 Tax=Mycena metata TaxID=1033252 RepID=A0AAD7HIB4_9AGAR|nr:hypothetical protein B0H16DRAFT_1738293 [Mycena metata]